MLKLMPYGARVVDARRTPVTVMPTDDRFLTVREVADLMRVSNMTVYRLIQSGDLGAARVGRSYRVRESEVEAYLNRGGA
jgi:excisionase family DNA binding protein